MIVQDVCGARHTKEAWVECLKSRCACGHVASGIHSEGAGNCSGVYRGFEGCHPPSQRWQLDWQTPQHMSSLVLLFPPTRTLRHFVFEISLSWRQSCHATSSWCAQILMFARVSLWPSASWLWWHRAVPNWWIALRSWGLQLCRRMNADKNESTNFALKPSLVAWMKVCVHRDA